MISTAADLAPPVMHRIDTPDGVQLALFDYPPAPPAVEAPPVLCLHGVTRNSRDFAVFCRRLQALGLRALALDVRGRGQSGYAADPATYQLAAYAQDVITVLDRLSIARATLVGTSMGGLITMTLATLAPDRIAGAALNDIGPVLAPGALARIVAAMAERVDFADWAAAEAHVRRANALAFPDHDGPGQEAFWAAFARRVCRQAEDGVRLDYDPALSAAAKTLAGLPPTPAPDYWREFKALAACATPLLVVRGAISDLLTPAAIAEMRQAAPAMLYVEAPRIGHAPFLTEDSVWPGMVDFLARCA